MSDHKKSHLNTCRSLIHVHQNLLYVKLKKISDVYINFETTRENTHTHTVTHLSIKTEDDIMPCLICCRVYKLNKGF